MAIDLSHQNRPNPRCKSTNVKFTTGRDVRAFLLSVTVHDSQMRDAALNSNTYVGQSCLGALYLAFPLARLGRPTRQHPSFVFCNLVNTP